MPTLRERWNALLLSRRWPKDVLFGRFFLFAAIPFIRGGPMRHAATLVLLLLVGGCLPYRSSGPGNPRNPGNPGNPRGTGVLVQATGGRCTNVVVAGTPRRVCLPTRGRRDVPADSVPSDSATADSV